MDSPRPRATDFPLARRTPRVLTLNLLVAGYLILGLIGVVLAAIGAPGRPSSAPGIDFFALGYGLLLAGASLLVGALIGFLFGIPRAGPVDHSELTYGASTSLETIADWLTKMLIGAFLVSVPQFPEAWQRFANLADLNPFGPPGPADRFGALISLYFAIAGFLTGYIFARLHFTAYSLRITPLSEGFRIALNLPLGPERAPAPLSLDDLQAVDRLAAAPRRQLRDDTELRAWAKAQVISGAGDLEGAISVYRRLVEGSTDATLIFEFADLLDRAKYSEEAQVFRERAKTLLGSVGGEPAPELVIQRMFSALYKKDGYREVIELGEPLTQRVQDERLWAYLACAYGQKHAALKQQKAPAEELDTARGRALYCVKQTLALNAGWRVTLRALWDPHAVRPGDDDDLTSLYEDPEFRAILDPESVMAAQSATLSQDIRSGIERALMPSALVKYSGHIVFGLIGEDGKALRRTAETSAWLIKSGHAFSFVAQLVPGSVPDGPSDNTVPLEVDGENRPEVEFELRVDSPEIPFSPNIMTVLSAIDKPTPQLMFGFEGPEQEGSYEFWVEISQARRTVQVIQAVMEVSAPGRRARPRKAESA